TTEPQSPLSETEKLAATLAELEAERERRLNAGQWSRAALPKLMAVLDGESLQVAQQKALYAHLAKHPNDPKSIAAYDWLELSFIGPKPSVELPGEQFEQPATRDVSPAPYRPPSPPPNSSRSL